MTTIDPWQELIKGLEIADEVERQKDQIVKEYRLYYNEDGTIIGMWESGYPAGDNFVVIDNPDVFHRNNTQYLKVINKELHIIDPRTQKVRQLFKSNTGYPVVKGQAALLIDPAEQYQNTEYYDRKNS